MLYFEKEVQNSLLNHSNIIIFRASDKTYISDAVTVTISIYILELNLDGTNFESRPNYRLFHLDFRNLFQPLVSKMALK
jgi:hypothetical protein